MALASVAHVQEQPRQCFIDSEHRRFAGSWLHAFEYVKCSKIASYYVVCDHRCEGRGPQYGEFGPGGIEIMETSLEDGLDCSPSHPTPCFWL